MARKTMFGVVGLMLLAGGWALAQSQQPPTTQCVLTGQGRFDLGWVEQTDTGSYKCVATFDASLKPAGAAWIKVNADGTIGKDIVR